jgi:hypothetical protein
VAPLEGVGVLRLSIGQERTTGDQREREREKTESVLTLTFGNYPCSYKRSAGGSALILVMRISSGVEKNSKMGGVQMTSQQRRQDWSFQEWFVDR